MTIRQEGRERYCEARLKKLNEVSDWVTQYKKFWNRKLDSLEVYLEDLQKSSSSKTAKGAKVRKVKTLKRKK